VLTRRGGSAHDWEGDKRTRDVRPDRHQYSQGKWSQLLKRSAPHLPRLRARHITRHTFKHNLNPKLFTHAMKSSNPKPYTLSLKP